MVKKVPKKAAAPKQLIVPTMTLGEIVEKYPQSIDIMMRYGLHCIGCHVSPFETLEQGAMGHGMSEEEFKGLLKELNEAAAKT